MVTATFPQQALDPDIVVLPSKLPPLPRVGESFADPDFGTRITRLSDAVAAGLRWTEHEYSRVDPFSPDGKYVLMLPGGQGFALFDLSGRKVKDLAGVLPKSEPRWSRLKPHTLYFIDSNSMYRLDVETDQIEEVATFDEYEVVWSGGEQDMSEDGRHWALMGGPDRNHPREVFVLNLETGKKGPVLDIRDAGNTPNSVTVTPDNRVLIDWNPPGGNSRYRGIELYDGDMRFLRQVTDYEGHADVARDIDGSEILVITNSADPTPTDGDHYIVKVRLDDSAETPLIRLDWRMAAHVSCRNLGAPGWALVSTYSPSNPDPGSGDWRPLENEIFAVRLDGSGAVVRLAHHRSLTIGSYTFQPRAVVSRNGRRVLFSSNLGLQRRRDGGASLSSDYVDVYLIDVPARLFDIEPTSDLAAAGGGVLGADTADVSAGRGVVGDLGMSAEGEALEEDASGMDDGASVDVDGVEDGAESGTLEGDISKTGVAGEGCSVAAIGTGRRGFPLGAGGGGKVMIAVLAGSSILLNMRRRRIRG